MAWQIPLEKQDFLRKWRNDYITQRDTNSMNSDKQSSLLCTFRRILTVIISLNDFEILQDSGKLITYFRS